MRLLESFSGIVELDGWVENEDYDRLPMDMRRIREVGMEELAVDGGALELWDTLTK